MNFIKLMVILIIFQLACTKETDEYLVSNLFFDCYDPNEFGELNPNDYKGLPGGCLKTIASENFDNNSRQWYEVNDEKDGIFEIRNGAYYIKTTNQYGYFYTRRSSFNIPSDNFEIEVSFTLIKSENKERHISIAFSGKEWEHHFVGFNLNKEVIIGTNNSRTTNATILDSVTNHTFLSNNVNKITIRKFNGIIYSFLNEQLVFTNEDLIEFGNEFGFRLPHTSEIIIDDFIIRNLNF